MYIWVVCKTHPPMVLDVTADGAPAGNMVLSGRTCKHLCHMQSFQQTKPEKCYISVLFATTLK
jgi:hypothetical protein